MLSDLSLSNNSGSLFSIIIPIIAVIFFIWKYELSNPESKSIALVAFLGGISAFLRVPFAAFPGIQPSTMLVFFAGFSIGKEKGAMAGLITAFVSNMFLGHGLWTLWQMAAWGSIGYLGGIIKESKAKIFLEERYSMAVIGVLLGIFFGLIVNIMTWIAFYPMTLNAFILVYLLSVWFDIMHGFGNAAFSTLFGKRFLSILKRYTIRFDVEYLD